MWSPNKYIGYTLFNLPYKSHLAKIGSELACAKPQKMYPFQKILSTCRKSNLFDDKQTYRGIPVILKKDVLYRRKLTRLDCSATLEKRDTPPSSVAGIDPLWRWLDWEVVILATAWRTSCLRMRLSSSSLASCPDKTPRYATGNEYDFETVFFLMVFGWCDPAYVVLYIKDAALKLLGRTIPR